MDYLKRVSRMRDRRDARIRQLKSRGLTDAQIAARVGITRQRVSQILQRMRVQG